MHKKSAYSLLALSIGVALTACGGGGSSTSSSSGPTDTYTAIDGYLSNAQVFIDKNDNKVADADELAGYTDRQGKIDINADGKAVIVKAIAGQTIDSAYGPVAQGFEMISDSGKLITPFTTLAVAQNTSLENIAAQFNLDLNDINQDYVQTNKGQPTLAQQQAYLLSRSIAPQLSATVGEPITNQDSIKEKAAKISESIQAVTEEDIKGYSENNIFDADGKLDVAKTAPWSLKNYLGNNAYYFYPLSPIALNTTGNNDDGIFKLQFDTNASPQTITFSDVSTGTNNTKVTLLTGNKDSKAYLEYQYNQTTEECEFSASDNPNTDPANGECISNIRYEFLYYSYDFAIATIVYKAESDLYHDTDSQQYDAISSLALTSDKGDLLSQAIAPDAAQFGSQDYYLLSDKITASSEYYTVDNEGDAIYGAVKSLVKVTPTVSGTALSIDESEYSIVAQNADMWVLNQNGGSKHIKLLFKEQAKATEICNDWKNRYKETVTIPGSCTLEP